MGAIAEHIHNLELMLNTLSFCYYRLQQRFSKWEMVVLQLLQENYIYVDLSSLYTQSGVVFKFGLVGDPCVPH